MEDSKNINELKNPYIVEFPLRGEWIAPTSPAKKIPSHGTDMLGQRFAFDFYQVDWNKNSKLFCNSNLLNYIIFGVPLHQCFAWGKAIFAPCDGIIIAAEDGLKERQRVHLIRDLSVVLKNAFFHNFEKYGLQPVLGNYIIMECFTNVYAFFAHIQNGSIMVKPGHKVRKGEPIANLGHSGNSTSPHLHFQLMDSPDILKAKGLPLAFETLDYYIIGNWETIENAIPDSKTRFRFLGK